MDEINKKQTVYESDLSNSLKSASLDSVPGLNYSTEIPTSYTDFNFVEVKKTDIKRIRCEYFNQKKKSSVGREIMKNIFLGLATTFVGSALSSIFASYSPDKWQFWVVYLAFPILGVICTFLYIIFQVVDKHRKEDFSKVVFDKLLEPTGFGEEENKHE